NLGTIARSGTAAFVEQMTGEGAKDTSLIGQFGVGFYSSFMVADRVTVTSRAADSDKAWRWISDGSDAFTLEAVPEQARGTTVKLHLRRGENEFLESDRLRRIVTTYSDHIALPIRFTKDDGETETVNTASALWMRPKKEISQEQYTEFYHHVAHAFDEPWLTLHNRAEGRLEYANLLFVPKTPPFNLFDPERKHGVKLYVKRVFITDDCEGLVPAWLRFLRGIVDSEDLPLNVSREMLQHSPVLARIGKALTKRVLTTLEKKAKKEPEAYAEFWEAFGAVLKEGLYEGGEWRDTLLGLFRAPGAGSQGLVGFADYIAGMKDGQDAIYYITGEDLEGLRHSPQLEGFVARGLDVLLLSDPIDEFWVTAVSDYEGKPFKSITRGDIDLSVVKDGDDDAKVEEKPPLPEGMSELVVALREALGEAVKDVRTSERLTDSAVCLIADEGALDMRLERLLREHKQLDQAAQKILEINPQNPLITSLAARAKVSPTDPALADAAQLLLDQARIIEGEPLPDPAAFAKRMTEAMARGLA
ncbi:MAG TPA: molecular chaperone HtpG, partial [Alphaproteobacteria bacterium]|nr:molecular chaperone HtpG [Alphaproteobacteria bacterium]